MGDAQLADSDGAFQGRRQLAVLAISAAIGVFNAASRWFLLDSASDWIETIVIGAWAMEPLLFAGWTALGPGSIVTRLPLALAGFAFDVAAPGLYRPNFADVERREFVSLFVAAMSLFAAATSLLLLVRWITGLRIEQNPGPKLYLGVRFDTKYLLVLMTLCAVTIATLSGLTFGKPRPALISFGPDFYIRIVIYGSLYCFFALLPVLAVAMFSLRHSPSRRAVWFVLVGWAISFVIMAGVWVGLMQEWGWEAIEAVGLIQLGAAAMAIPAAFVLRTAGYRLRNRPDGLVAM